ncbi:Heavy metal transport/detoxification superfamily protein [Arabidopsis thaliana]|jgi:copper chaperone CopZ|uniref:Heavy metal transport/detoxification superfamily protein n=2 Tax=Arabidopsis thaliana TaxID=3702 RepID=B3H4U8_ARATH|nr:Heavy metal transport/detoxification superfamily protein [Arabidopsis thaliana]AED95986.1 Heavy metal transport/detoxification superfamily protein [Arabidopsis thaliana]|eukprot:NP_001119410.1 Heavy metal transport/detoxification superfamily protein [Arabidopsis thaliana]
MGEEDKKMEEKKSEEPQAKSEDKKPEEEKKKEPQEIVLKIFMHCEGCAKKIHRCLKGFEGVEDVTTDCKTSKVVVKGEKADPLKVLQRLQRKSHRQVELISPIPEPKPVSDEPEKKEKEKPKPEEKKEEVVTVVLRVHMHCEACAMEIQKRIMRMKGVESVEPDFKASQVSVKGVFTPEKLVEFIYKRIGKHAAVVKQDPPPKPPEKEKETKDKDEKKKEEGQPKEGKEAKENGGGGGAKGDGAAAEEGNKVVDLKKNEYQYQPPRYPVEMFAYPPQIFSDENPNACTII